MRAIRMVIKARVTDMGGVIVDQPLPYPGVEQIDPFLLIHHFKDELPGGQDQRDLGVGPHPHRGFSPVTFIFEGEVHHRDSRNNNSIVGKGGTQWMNSGMGIIHSERPSSRFSEEGGTYEIVQFWVNSAAAHKMGVPSYQAIPKEEIPVLSNNNDKFRVGIVSGKLEGREGPVKPKTDVISLRMNWDDQSDWHTNIPELYNTILYVLEGHIKVNGTEVTDKQMVWFGNEGQHINLEGIKKGKAVLLAGRPLNEEVVQQGPFVMNSDLEIMEAMRDYRMGKMGFLVEQFDPIRR